MMKIKVNWEEKEIVFWEYTRAIDKWFKNILYKDFCIGIWEDASSSKFNPLTLEEANDYLIKSLTNLSEEEVQNLTNSDYQKILDECKKIQNPPTSSTNW